MNLRRLIMLVTLSIFLGACRPNSPQPAQSPTENPKPNSTSTPEPTPTLATPTQTATVTPTVTASPTATPSYPVEGYGPDNFPANVNPLTGLVVPDPEVLQRRPLAVKVNILPSLTNRPPWGISFADIVHEYYNNSGMTRFHAIFLSQDSPLVGPIRSGRMPDGPLVRMYKSIFAYSGADGNVDITLRNSIFGYRLARDRGPRTECPPTVAVPLCRFDPQGLDLLLAGTREVHENMQNRGVDDEAQNLDGMFFQMQPPAGGERAPVVSVRYSLASYNRWEYDDESGRYLRFQDNVVLRGEQEEEYVPLLDRVTGEQVAFDNVVVVYIPHEYFREPPGEIISIEFTGNGKAYAFRDGQGYELVWDHPILDSVMTLEYENGEPYAFKPGTTWFQIIGQFSELSHPEADTWRFRYWFP